MVLQPVEVVGIDDKLRPSLGNQGGRSIYATLYSTYEGHTAVGAPVFPADDIILAGSVLIDHTLIGLWAVGAGVRGAASALCQRPRRVW